MFDLFKNYHNSYNSVNFYKYSATQAIYEIKKLAKTKQFKHINNKKYDMLYCENTDTFYSGFQFNQLSKPYPVLNIYSNFYIIKIYSEPEEIFLAIDTKPPFKNQDSNEYIVTNELDDVNMKICVLFDKEEIMNEASTLFFKMNKILDDFFDSIDIKEFYFNISYYGVCNDITKPSTNRDIIKIVKTNINLSTTYTRPDNISYLITIQFYSNLSNGSNDIEMDIYMHNPQCLEPQYNSKTGLFTKTIRPYDDHELEKFVDFVNCEKSRKYIEYLFVSKQKYILNFDKYRENFIKSNNLDFLKRNGITMEDYIITSKYRNGVECINIGNDIKKDIKLINTKGFHI